MSDHEEELSKEERLEAARKKFEELKKKNKKNKKSTKKKASSTTTTGDGDDEGTPTPEDQEDPNLKDDQSITEEQQSPAVDDIEPVVETSPVPEVEKEVVDQEQPTNDNQEESSLEKILSDEAIEPESTFLTDTLKSQIESLTMFSKSLRISRSLTRSQSTLTKVIGIDLGTTNSAVAITQNKIPTILETSTGNRTVPSTVAFTSQGDVLVGEPAKRQALVNYKNTIYAAKRLMGRKFEDMEVQNSLKNLPYSIVPNDNGDASLKINSGINQVIYSPSQISGFILREMKKIAELQIGEPIKNAVITVPAYFNDSQRQATKQAGELIGLNVLRVVNEPTAASLAYGLGAGAGKDGIVAVYDLGGGTFDISILDIDDGVFEVLATNGDTHLGGEDFDDLLVNYITEQVKKIMKDGEILNPESMQRIKQAAEKCKIELSHIKETNILLPFIGSQGSSLDLKFTEDELDEMSLGLIDKTIAPVKKALKDADLKINDIDEVILVGGMTRMPKIRKIVEDFFKKKPNTQVNPDEAVALGAAIQGAVLSGEVQDVLLLDVTPLTLGIETYGGLFSPLLPRNTTVPCKIKQMYSTAVDGQNSIDINVYQGERPLVQDNKLIGNFKLTDIPILPKGEPQVEVSFDIDADGIIKVSALEKTTGKKSSITVFGKTGISQEEVEKMIEEGKKSTKEDQIKANYLKLVNNLELITFDTEQALIDWGKFVEDSSREQLMNKVHTVRRMIEDSRKGDLFDAELIKAAQEELKAETLIVIEGAAIKSKQKSNSEFKSKSSEK
ncbi:hypothetical protein CANARDRAFT_201827 [[Candida] arabinofermentans NRRL YB-2248]|uniref:Iron-sulfur cluster biogenesis chaperone, mitochondrial n=1 Tax=[Candida] arabinofermentans NRRL YB-2248 TaxID=983967 RepID=A0A1E4SX17_9ASCO|nr:hypothetical protein CANARDRAFT_201827 [[Candida] arabinofermentans NRRL YB-2248]